MRPRLEQWLEETHGARFELLRHFLARFFEGEMVGSSGDWARLAAGGFAMLPMSWVMMFMAWNMKYGALLRMPNPRAYRLEVRSDAMCLIAIAMCLTAALTAIEWNALFPSRRDLLSLAALPLRPGEVFVSKFGALAVMFSAFVAILTVPAGFVFVCVINGRWQEGSILTNAIAFAVAGAAACTFVFFSAVGLQGLLLNLLPARAFAQVSVFAQAALFTLSVGLLPSVARPPAGNVLWPPKWFLGLWGAIIGVPDGASRNALLSVGAALAVALISYLASYRRYERVLLEGAAHRGRELVMRAVGKLGAWILDLWVRDPREQAMFVFVAKTFSRSRNHRLVLLAYLGIALGWVAKALVGHTGGGSRVVAAFVVLAPMAITLVVTAALKYLFSLPVELGANWIFQITEQDGRRSWLRAVERFVVWCGIAPVYALVYPMAASVMGAGQALAATVLSFGLVVLVFEAMFLQWQKAPFTCSYLPGKRPVVFQTVPMAAALTSFGPAVLLVLWGASGTVPFLVFASLEAIAIACFRIPRRRAWSEQPLIYVDELDPAVTTLDIGVRVGAVELHGALSETLFPTGVLQIPPS